MKEKTVLIVIGAVVAALLLGSIFYLAGRAQGRRQATGLQGQVDTLRQENRELKEQNEDLAAQVASLQEENRQLQVQPETSAEPQINRFPKTGWEAYFPTAETTTLAGQTTGRVRELLGEPPFLIRGIAANPEFNREIWIFNAAPEDPTGLYLFFKANKLNSSRLDEFQGLYNSGLLDLEAFWLN
jgi:hypothetical protein